MEVVGIVCLVAAICALDLSRLYLYWRQFNVVKETTKMPRELASGWEEPAFDDSRNVALQKVPLAILSIIVRIFSRTYRVYTSGCAIAWGATAEWASDNAGRVIAYNVFAMLSGRLPLVPLNTAIMIMRGSAPVNQALLAMTNELFQLFSQALLTAATTHLLIRFTDAYLSNGFLYLCPVSVIVGAVFTIVYVRLIVPMMSDPLPSGPLSDKLRTVTMRFNFPLDRIYIERLQTRELFDPDSPEINAYYCGLLGVNMVVLSKQLTTDFSPDEISAVVAHELGHWHSQHTTLYFTIATIELFLVCYFLKWSYNNEFLYNVFGFDLEKDRPHAILGVFLFTSTLYPLFKQFTSMVVSPIARLCEFGADKFATERGYGEDLKRALLLITRKSENFPIFDRWYSLLLLSHPPVLERINWIDCTHRYGNASTE